MDESVMFFRLSNGEDIVASVVFGDDEDLILHEPLKVVYLPRGKGLLSISFMQWVFGKITKNQEFLINMKDVITMSVPSISLVEHYHETVQYFQKHDLVHLNKVKTNKMDEEAMDEMFDDMEEELKEGSNVEEVIQFLNTILSSNNKGTLH